MTSGEKKCGFGKTWVGLFGFPSFWCRQGSRPCGHHNSDEIPCLSYCISNGMESHLHPAAGAHIEDDLHWSQAFAWVVQRGSHRAPGRQNTQELMYSEVPKPCLMRHPWYEPHRFWRKGFIWEIPSCFCTKAFILYTESVFKKLNMIKMPIFLL